MTKIILLIFLIFITVSAILSKMVNNRLFKNSKKLILTVFMLCIFAVLLTFRIVNNKGIDGQYTPAKFDGKTLSPGKVEFDK